MRDISINNVLTYAWAPVALHPGGVRRAGGAGGVNRGGPQQRRCLPILLGQIQDAPDGKTELGRGSHGVLCVRVQSGLCFPKKQTNKHSRRSLYPEEEKRAADPLHFYALSKHQLGNRNVCTAGARCLRKQHSISCKHKAALLFIKPPPPPEYLNGWSAVTQ